jgi:tetratricopeptide (TPR) repeat protein
MLLRRGVSAMACLVVLLGAARDLCAQAPPHPTDLPPAYRGSAIDSALQSQDWPKAEALLVAAIDRAPRERQLLKVLGSVFLVQRKPLNAAIAFKKADALAALEDPARFALVLAYIAMNRGDWARPELETLHASDPSNPLYDYWLGRLDYDGGHYASAVERFERVIALDPTFARAYDNLGLCLEAQNEPERALPHYRTAVALNRKAPAPSAWPPLNLATLLRQRGAVEEAEALLREAIRVDDGNAQAHYQLGLVLEQTNRADEAVVALARAAANDPQYAPPHYALARIYRRMGRSEESKQALAVFERLHQDQREAKGR